jgi:hypothetical protein
MITLEQAILSLNPNAEFTCNGGVYSGLTWTNNPSYKPTEEEVNAEIARLEAEYDAKEYQRNRLKEYPAIADQLDYIYHNGIDAWKTDMIEPVKTKYPKGAV